MVHRGAALRRVQTAVVLGLVVAGLLGRDCCATENEAGAGAVPDFTEYTLEELVDIDLTSAAKYPKPLFRTAAAVFVITREDIRRSGFTTLPDLFRMVPGMQVARSDPGDFAVSTRGFIGEYANKLLVLVDGRSVYSPLFGGTFWERCDVLLDNIERIEVIRGPGASLWGANAVNGVVNIITRNAADTQGLLATTAFGNTSEWYSGLRYGGRVGENLHYTIYAKYMKYGMVDNELQSDPEYSRGGFRLDWHPTAADTFLLTGDYMIGHEKARTSRPLVLHGSPENEMVRGEGNPAWFHVLGRWSHVTAAGSEMTLHFFYDGHRHRARRSVSEERWDDCSDLRQDKARLDIYDVDVQYRFTPAERHELIWGLGFRLHHYYKRECNIFYTLDPTTRYTHLYSAFVQDEIDLIPDSLQLIVGSRFEYNSYTNFELQPTLRLLWAPRDRHVLWLAVSRAVRIPTLLETDATVRLAAVRPRPGRRAVLREWRGDEGFDSETLLAYEVGYRYNLNGRFSLDAAAFYNVYDDLLTLEPRQYDRARGYLTLPLESDNEMDGTTCGLELAVNAQLAAWWRVQGTFTWLQMNLEADSGSRAASPDAGENLSPSTQCTLRSLMDIGHRFELDTSLYFTDDIPGYGIKRYTNVSIRLGWQPVKNVDISFIAHNLLDNKHNEFTDELFRRAENEVRRSFFTRITLEF